MKMLRFGLCFVGLLAGVFELYAADQVALKLRYPEGRTARYKNKYSFQYFSDKAEIILSEGTFEVSTYGEWRSQETVVPAEAEGAKGDRFKVVARVDKAGSQVTLSGQRLTYETFPYTLDMLDKLSFSWGVGPGGRIDKFGPEFPAFKVERKDMITDLRQIWMPGLAPGLPEKEVSVGDTWTDEQRIEVPFYSFDAGSEPSLIQFTSTYKVKKIKKKKGRQVVEIEEKRKIHCRIWMHIEVVSLIIEGEGTGHGKWEIDTDLGLVLSHEMKIGIGRPQVRQSGDWEPIGDIEAQIELIFSRKLDKLEKE